MSDWLDAEAHADRALEMYERGRWAEAEAELRKALSLNPDQAEWHFNLGLTLEAAGRDEDAMLSYERAIALMPEEAEPHLAAGALANRLGRYRDAITWLERAISLDGASESAYAQKMESHIRLGEHDEAETTFYLAQHTLDEPGSQCLAVMGESLMQRELHERAEWCLKEALRLDPQLPRVRARLAALAAASGHPQRALQLYVRELRDDPGNIDTLLEYGVLLMRLNRLPEAAEKFRRVLELEPANVDAHFELGRIAMASKRYEQAHLEFELVLKLDGQFPGVRLAIGEALLHRGRAADAAEHLRAEHDQLKASVEELLAASRSEQKQEKIGELMASLERPDCGLTLARLAALLLEADEAERAGTLLQIAVNREESADLLRQLAFARFRAGDREGGMAASRRALRLDPACCRSMHNLALAALEQGQPRLAAGWVKRGLAVNRHDDGLRRLRVRVWLAHVAMLWRWWRRRA